MQSQFPVSEPNLSPDGKWLAHLSTESGEPQIYVQPFPRGSGRWQVSSTGGDWPEWSGDGREIFYQSADGKLMSAGITEAGSRLIVGKDTLLFPIHSLVNPGWPYDVSADGKQFVVANQEQAPGSQALTLVANWPALLKSR